MLLTAFILTCSYTHVNSKTPINCNIDFNCCYNSGTSYTFCVKTKPEYKKNPTFIYFKITD